MKVKKFSEAFDKEKSIEYDENEKEAASFEWHPENHPELINVPSVYIKEGKYYLQLNWDMPLYEITEEFLTILYEANIL